jgi:hypothetical protein
MNKSCLFFGLSGVSAEGGVVERTLSPCGGIVNIILSFVTVCAVAPKMCDD